MDISVCCPSKAGPSSQNTVSLKHATVYFRNFILIIIISISNIRIINIIITSIIISTIIILVLRSIFEISSRLSGPRPYYNTYQIYIIPIIHYYIISINALLIHSICWIHLPFMINTFTVDFRSFLVFSWAETLAHWNPTSRQKNNHNRFVRIWDSQIENSKIEIMETDRTFAIAALPAQHNSFNNNTTNNMNKWISTTNNMFYSYILS